MKAPLTLALDASTYVGTAALLRGSTVLAATAVPMRTPDRETLLPAIAALLSDAGIAARDLERVVCGDGPGSFTSLRIAAATAKGIALGAGASLYSMSSLMLIVAGNDIVDQPGRYVAVLDALRGDVYAGAYEVTPDHAPTELASPTVMPRDEALERAHRLAARVVGPQESPPLAPHARGVARLIAQLDAAPPRDLASWEPCYGRPAEAQARWEREHGRPLASA